MRANRSLTVRPPRMQPWRRRPTMCWSRLFPAQAADLDAKYVTALNGLPDDAARANGVAVGQQAAAAILAARANDGRDGTVTYVPGSGPGVYAPTPPAFLAGAVARDPTGPAVCACSPPRSSGPNRRRILAAGCGRATTTRSKALGANGREHSDCRADRHRTFLER